MITLPLDDQGLPSADHPDGREAGGRPWFNVAKTAQTALIKNLSLNRDIVRDGITFNSVAPGGIMVPDTGWQDEQKKDWHKNKRP